MALTLGQKKLRLKMDSNVPPLKYATEDKPDPASLTNGASVQLTGPRKLAPIPEEGRKLLKPVQPKTGVVTEPRNGTTANGEDRKVINEVRFQPSGAALGKAIRDLKATAVGTSEDAKKLEPKPPTKKIIRGLPLRPPIPSSIDPYVTDTVPRHPQVDCWENVRQIGSKKDPDDFFVIAHVGNEEMSFGELLGETEVPEPWPPARRVRIQPLAYQPIPVQSLLSKKKDAEMYAQLTLKIQEMKNLVTELRGLLAAGKYMEETAQDLRSRRKHFLKLIAERETTLQDAEIVLESLRRETQAHSRMMENGKENQVHIRKMALQSLTRGIGV